LSFSHAGNQTSHIIHERAHAQVVLELLLQVGNGYSIRRDAWIDQHVEAFRQGLVANFQTRLILTGRHRDAVFIFDVPHDAIQSGVLRDARWRRPTSSC